MTGGFTVLVTGHPSPHGTLLRVRVSLEGFEGAQAEVHDPVAGGGGVEWRRRTELGAVALGVAREYADAALGVVRAAEVRARDAAHG